MNKYLLILIFFFPSYHFGYTNNSIDSTSGSIGYFYTYSLNASSIGAKNIIKYFYSDFIDETLKSNILTNFQQDCRFNLSTKLGHAIFNINFNKPIIKSLIFGLSDNNITYGKFSKNLLNIYLNGNKTFAGTTTDLYPINLIQNRHKEVYFDIRLNTNTKNLNHQLTLTPKLLFGNKFTSYNIKHANIFTEEIGEYININLEGNLIKSDSLNDYDHSLNGFGLGLNINYSIKYKNRHSLHLGINNIGFINWNNRSNIINIDTAIHFEGIYIHDITTITDSIFTYHTDSLTSFNLGNQQRYFYNLPYSINIQYDYHLNKQKIKKISTGFIYKVNSFHTPLIYAEGFFTFHKNTIIPRVEFGGYNRFGLGGAYNIKLYNYGLSLHLENIQSLVFRQSKGLGFGIYLIKYLK